MAVLRLWQRSAPGDGDARLESGARCERTGPPVAQGFGAIAEDLKGEGRYRVFQNVNRIAGQVWLYHGAGYLM